MCRMYVYTFTSIHGNVVDIKKYGELFPSGRCEIYVARKEDVLPRGGRGNQRRGEKSVRIIL